MMDISYYKGKYEPIWGKWFLSKELGRGAYGTVFEAETRDADNIGATLKSALKIISIPSSPSEIDSYTEEHFGIDKESVSSYFYGFVEEFLKEISIMAKLKGKSNIVSIEDYEVKEHTENVGWDILIRMELLTSLNKYFTEKSITEKDVVNLGVDICRALEECEKLNIIHRDIKPSNIFVSDAGKYKLGDFGVARTLEKTSSGLSKKGTYTYMAPEVYKGEDCYSSNVDTYSLGIVMYKLLNNNFEPFRTQLTSADEENAFKSRLKNEPMPKPANASDEVAQIILKACSYEAKDRYSSAQIMREELEKTVVAKKHTIESEATISFEFPIKESLTYGLFDEKYIEKKEEKTEPEELISENSTPQKNKILALCLAIIPYNIFGLYQFYMNGIKKGLLRLCTLNFFMIGYFMDCYEASMNFFNLSSNKRNKKI